jgi:gamma-glutamylputrescine oxidase
VGAGFTGLSTAIHLAKRGFKVVILEGAKVGWGASGRNGGQAIIGYNSGIGSLEKRYGRAAAKNYLDLALEGCQIIKEHIKEFAIECDYKSGHVGLATDTSQLRAMEAEKSVWARCGHDDIQMIPNHQATKNFVASENYVGGFVEMNGGHLHPLNLAIGEAKGFVSLGGQIYEQSCVTQIDISNTPTVYTHNGEVHAKYVVLAGNAYLGNLVPKLEAKLIPVSTFIIATQKLGRRRANDLLKKDYGYTDWRYVLDYYRLTADSRLLFGGKSLYGGAEPKNFAEQMRNDMLKVFPQMSDVNIDYAWAGNFAITYSRMPDVGRLSNSHVFYAQGYSGHGVTTTHMMGRLMAEIVSGTAERFDLFATINQIPFPGGKYFKIPAVVMGGWYYNIKDAISKMQ